MSVRSIVARARRVLSRPPSYILMRAWAELRHETDRLTQPRLGRRFDLRRLLARTGARDLDELWERVAASAARGAAAPPTAADYVRWCPGDLERVVAAADRAAGHEIDLLGSGPVSLGPVIDWHRDFKTGDTWRRGYFRSIDYINRGRPSDVKTVWELSRLQWLLPCGQAYALTGEERYAESTRDVIEQWIDSNPYACSVNWGVTMEPALRIGVWIALLRYCGRSRAWSSSAFRSRFLTSLYLHAVFTERFIERSAVNGNHFTADATALVVAGALFWEGQDAVRWFESGLNDLESEILLQVHADGVDFEASTAYHRLVAELLLAASVAAEARGRVTSSQFRDRLRAMARFTAAYMRPDLTAPLWGDHDDARVLPFGPQGIRDHRYLIGLIGLHLNDASLIGLAGGSPVEAVWWFGSSQAMRLPAVGREQNSEAFPEGGAYIICGFGDHVFIDCGPLGLNGRGGHGHNDLLSFEAILDGIPIVTEGGCYVYTADFASRNRDRSTASHNTPQIDGEEVNRFLGDDLLWLLADDAGFALKEFSTNIDGGTFTGCHTGYRRLRSPVTVERSIRVAHSTHSISISDRFVADGPHFVEVPLHLHPDAEVIRETTGQVLIRARDRVFEVEWSGQQWSLSVEAGREAASYGRQRSLTRLAWRTRGAPKELSVSLRALDRQHALS
jgi:Heparinase II/III-like protein/Heparinase II/III N-terminus